MCNEQTAAAELSAVLKTDRVREAEKRLTGAVSAYREQEFPVDEVDRDITCTLAMAVADAHIALEDAIEAEAEKIAESIAKAQREIENPTEPNFGAAVPTPIHWIRIEDEKPPKPNNQTGYVKLLTWRGEGTYTYTATELWDGEQWCPEKHPFPVTHWAHITPPED